jgi:hypothetical protein
LISQHHDFRADSLGEDDCGLIHDHYRARGHNWRPWE